MKSTGQSRETGQIVNLALHRGDDLAPASDEAAPFGVRLERSARQIAAANEEIDTLLSRLVIDESLPYYVAILDGTVIYVNEGYKRLDHLLGSVSLAPGDASVAVGRKVRSLLTIIEDVASGGQTVRTEESASIGNYERVFMGRHMPVRAEDGTLIAVAGTYEDVTLNVRGVEEISRTHAKFQDFTRASSDWFFELDADMALSSLSERFTAQVGQPCSLFIGAEFEQFGHFDRNIDGQFDGLMALKSRKPFRDLLFVMDGSDGKPLQFHLSGVPVFDRKSGEFMGYRGVGMDMSARYRQANEAMNTRANLEKILEELTRKNLALDEANAQAEIALKAKNDFLATMSHELRTPLNAIIGFAESFTAETFGELNKMYLEYAADIGSSGRHLLSLINDILDVAVIEGGGLALHMGDVVLEHVVEKATHMVQESAKAKSLTLHTLENTGSQTWVRADDKRLTQVLVNLLSNAVKFTPEGGEIGLELQFGGEDTMLLSVWDTGVGIPEMYQERIFEKFHQVTDDIYSRSQEGTGLGLHISRELARKMGGEISVASVEGEGSRFTVSLCLTESAAEAEDDTFI